jgi:3-isopropylmalate/(R)-2-methylmalate dehydratase large subunit
MAAQQCRKLDVNCKEFGVTLHGLGSPHRGIVHVIGPELGLDAARHDHRLWR